MIVAADAAHDPKERFRRNENTEAIAQNHQRSRDLKDPCQQKHGEGHRNSGNEPREETTKPYFGSAHHLIAIMSCRCACAKRLLYTSDVAQWSGIGRQTSLCAQRSSIPLLVCKGPVCCSPRFSG